MIDEQDQTKHNDDCSTVGFDSISAFSIVLPNGSLTVNICQQ